MARPKKRQTRKTWTLTDLGKLKKLIKAQTPAKMIASKMGRSEGAIRVKAFMEGVSFKAKKAKSAHAYR
jgi:hypothetical protein